MLNIPENEIRKIGKVLLDTKRPLKERFRALFTLRNIGGPIAIECIQNCFTDESALLKHELAYCLGQMQDPNANSILINVLENLSEHPMVRHEAAEALGAIGSDEAVEILNNYKNDSSQEVAETCQLALERINWLEDKDKEKEEAIKSVNPYKSVDPAPPLDTKNLEELKGILLNDEESLFQRYRAMFALRNLNNEEAVKVLGLGLKCGTALFRHEIAFVLGQMQNSNSVECLKESLENPFENEMVRHECAEALGAIATGFCMDILTNYVNDDKRVVRESCEIALDMCEYENSPEFQYANTLTTLTAE